MLRLPPVHFGGGFFFGHYKMSDHKEKWRERRKMRSRFERDERIQAKIETPREDLKQWEGSNNERKEDDDS